MASGGGSRVVFVGNIPYDGSEQQLIDLFNTVGTVVSFRLVTDKDTGKPRGYGFCEFKDPATAQSAIRNLNGAEFHGRSLRVGNATEDKAISGSTDDITGQPGPYGRRHDEEPSLFSQHPVQPETLVQIVSSLSEEQRIEILSQMKILIQQNPAGAAELLSENPQLAQGLLHIQASFGLISPADFQNFALKREPIPPPMVPSSGPPMGYPPSGPPPGADVGRGYADPRGRPGPPVDMGSIPPRGPPRDMMRGPPPSGPPAGQPLPPQGGSRGYAPPMEPVHPSVAHLPPEMQEQFAKLMAMPPEQLAMLPPDIQQQVQQIRSGALPGRAPIPPSGGGRPRPPY